MGHRPAEAKDRLARHADYLRCQVRNARLLSPDQQGTIDDLEFIADAIERVVDGKVKSLDQALGLKRGRGRVSSADGKPGKHFQMVLHIVPLILGGLNWEQIIDQLHEEGEFEFYDGAHELEKIFERERVAAMEWYAAKIRQN